jgi:hypothetical protein
MNSRILVIVLFAAFCSHGQVSVYNQNSNEFNTGIKPTQEKKSLYDLVVLNYTDLVSIEKCKKVEIGIDLSEEIEERIQLFLAGDSGSKFPLNPFISDDLNPNTSELAIHATFVHSSTQTVKERDFFYYHDYVQKGEGWKDDVNKANKYLMRVRFAPSLPGEWKSTITINLDGERTQLPEFNFQVLDNDHAGFVKVHKNKRNLELGGEIIFPIGHVFPGPYNRANGGQTPWGDIPNGPQANTTAGDWNQFIGDIKSYINQGGESFKLIQTAYGNLLEFEEKGNYIKRMHYAWEQDKIMDLCEENNVLINFNLLFQDVIMGYGQNGSGTYGDPWDYGNYGQDGPVPFSADYYPTFCYFKPGTLPSHQFLDTVLMNFHKQRTRYYVARYGYSPQIYTWELMSEPFHMDQFHRAEISHPITGVKIDDEPATNIEHPGHEVAIEAINRYHNKLSDYMKNELKDHDHLITIDQSIIDDNSAIYPYQSAFNPSIDIIGYNYYSAKPDKLVISKDDKNGKNNTVIDDNETTIFKLFTDKFLLFHKPIILSESGHGSTEMQLKCIGTSGNIIDAMTLCYSGIAGIHPWEGYQYGNYNQYDERLLWPSTIASEKFMNSNKVTETLNNLEGNWDQGRQVEKIAQSDIEYPKELQYYISQNKELSTGYVRNRSYNIYTMRTDESCSLAENYDAGFEAPLHEFTPIDFELGSVKSIFNRYIYVTGLKRKTFYEITWYDFISGEVLPIKQTQRSDSKSRLKVEFPDLTLETPQRPIVWFSMKKVAEPND